MVAKERACQSSHGEFMVCFNRNQRARRIIHKPISMIRSDAATKGSKTLSLYNRGIRPEYATQTAKYGEGFSHQ
jgi:hypothetical protein